MLKINSSFLKLDSKTSRPLIGRMNINEFTINYTTPASYVKSLNVFIHELFHILFFNISLFDFYPSNSRNQSFKFEPSIDLIALRGDTILREVRNHYNCSTLNEGKLSYLLNYSSFGE